jgi:3',5'-cyclic AMP phosphodiesterase CpdA
VVNASILVVSDSHLSVRAPEADANWAAVAAVAGRFDLVLHVGDLTLDATQHPEDLPHARALLEALPAPWVAVPGNHDLGDNPSTAGGPVITPDRRQRWSALIGPDHWSVEVGTWTIVGINAQLFGSGLEDERLQWAWLKECLAGVGSSRPIAFVTHKPLAASADELAQSPVFRFVPKPGRARLEALLDRVRCPVVLSGHVHQFRLLDHGGRRHVWAPTTWAVLPEALQRTVGRKASGAVSLQLGPDGEVSAAFEEVPRLRQLTIGEEIPDPYT